MYFTIHSNIVIHDVTNTVQAEILETRLNAFLQDQLRGLTYTGKLTVLLNKVLEQTGTV